MPGADHLELELAQASQRVEVSGERALARSMNTLPMPSTVPPLKRCRRRVKQTLSAEWPAAARARNGPTRRPRPGHDRRVEALGSLRWSAWGGWSALLEVLSSRAAAPGEGSRVAWADVDQSVQVPIT